MRSDLAYSERIASNMHSLPGTPEIGPPEVELRQFNHCQNRLKIAKINTLFLNKYLLFYCMRYTIV